MPKIWFVLCCVLASVTVPLRWAGAGSPGEMPGAASQLLNLTKDDRVLGKPNAPITIVEYASMSCPHCAHFTDEVLPELKKKWIDTGKVKLVLRDFPLDEVALKASMIARCAPPDRFYAFVDTMFATQEKWVGESDPQAALARLAKLGGMSQDEIDACLKNSALENKIVEGRLVASKDLDVNATPTFFINGTKFTGAPTEEAFDKALTGLAPKS
ncbi:MAG: DsbA family protein [Stellaceae bacterium]